MISRKYAVNTMSVQKSGIVCYIIIVTINAPRLAGWHSKVCPRCVLLMPLRRPILRPEVPPIRMIQLFSCIRRC